MSKVWTRKDCELSVIATYNEKFVIDGQTPNHQECFIIGITESALRSEEAVIDWVLSHLYGDTDDLQVLSLAWDCSQAIVDRFPSIQQCMKQFKYLPADIEKLMKETA
jgi:hypothetical protein